MIALVLKTRGLNGSVGSNPTDSSNAVNIHAVEAQ